MKSEVAKWIASWPLWKQQVARGILSRELTRPLLENDEDSDDRRETEQGAAVRASEEPVKGDEAESEQQRRGKE